MLPNCEEEKGKKKGTPARHVGDAELAVEEREVRKEVGTKRGRGGPAKMQDANLGAHRSNNAMHTIGSLAERRPETRH